MRFLPKTIALAWALILLTAASFSAAQDETQLTIAGSGIANSLIESIASSLGIDGIDVRTTGTSAGIEQFCRGSAAIVSASRPISAAEAANCLENEVMYSEFLLAHKIVAFAANGSLPATCLSRSQLEAFLKPSSSNQDMDWSAFMTEGEAPALTILTPSAESLEYAIVDGLVAGDRLRRDVEVYGDVGEAITRTTEITGALAILPYSTELQERDGLAVLGFEDEGNADCIEPSAENVEANLYSAAQSVYAYVNRGALQDHDALSELLEQLTSNVSADAVMRVGFTPPSAEAYTLNSQALSDPMAAVSLSDGGTDFTIPPNLSGQVAAGGAANAYQLLERTATMLSSANTQLQVNIGVASQVAAISELCNGDLDIAMINTLVDDVDLTACDDLGVETLRLPIGAQATILLGNSADEYSACLTREQIMTIWQAPSAEAVNSWNEVDEAFPAQDMVLFGPSTVDRYADMLLANAGGAIAPIRRDTETHFDPLYRAAAVGNVSGALTFMPWQDYLDVLNKEQANVRLVAVDDGAGCVIPSEASISEGSYALARPASLLVREEALAELNLQSFLWSLYSDDNWDNFERDGFLGMARADLAVLRRQLETHFRLAESKYALDETETDAESSEESG